MQMNQKCTEKDIDRYYEFWCLEMEIEGYDWRLTTAYQ